MWFKSNLYLHDFLFHFLPSCALYLLTPSFLEALFDLLDFEFHFFTQDVEIFLEMFFLCIVTYSCSYPAVSSFHNHFFPCSRFSCLFSFFEFVQKYPSSLLNFLPKSSLVPYPIEFKVQKMKNQFQKKTLVNRRSKRFEVKAVFFLYLLYFFFFSWNVLPLMSVFSSLP